MVRALQILAITLLLSACASREPSPYDEYQARRLERMTLSVMTVQGTLTDAQGKGVSGLTVNVSSPRYNEDARTANSGYFSVTSKFSPDDSLDFHFSGGGIEWTASLVTIPRGVGKLGVRFVLRENGTIHLAALEY